MEVLFTRNVQHLNPVRRGINILPNKDATNYHVTSRRLDPRGCASAARLMLNLQILNFEQCCMLFPLSFSFPRVIGEQKQIHQRKPPQSRVVVMIHDNIPQNANLQRIPSSPQLPWTTPSWTLIWKATGSLLVHNL
jgi:hypothetical protein